MARPAALAQLWAALALTLGGDGAGGGESWVPAGYTGFVLGPDAEEPTDEELEAARARVETTLAAAGYKDVRAEVEAGLDYYGLGGASVAVVGDTLEVSAPGVDKKTLEEVMFWNRVQFRNEAGEVIFDGREVNFTDTLKKEKTSAGADIYYLRVVPFKAGTKANQEAVDAGQVVTLYIDSARCGEQTPDLLDSDWKGAFWLTRGDGIDGDNGQLYQSDVMRVSGELAERGVSYPLVCEWGESAAGAGGDVAEPSAAGGDMGGTGEKIRTINITYLTDTGEMSVDEAMERCEVLYEALAKTTDGANDAEREKLFREAMAEFNQDPGMAQLPQGYVFGEGVMEDEYYQAASDLGEYAFSPPVSFSRGVAIIMRLPL